MAQNKPKMQNKSSKHKNCKGDSRSGSSGSWASGQLERVAELVAKDDESVAMLQCILYSPQPGRMHIVRAQAVELDWMSQSQSPSQGDGRWEVGDEA
ncbi:hypothetical protein AWZ03_001511 [Drosophila navojoa]|uniref:Uncharacterized protein n=1 Tax=Drosophila navojoa TaxID=7232 RepID=A0A484BVW4_DRONA|nr:hypothetical protein AWZ03_001511 [Drosophila navojoa]